MFFKKKKEKELDVLNEDKIHNKLYGHLEEKSAQEKKTVQGIKKDCEPEPSAKEPTKEENLQIKKEEQPEPKKEITPKEEPTNTIQNPVEQLRNRILLSQEKNTNYFSQIISSKWIIIIPILIFGFIYGPAIIIPKKKAAELAQFKKDNKQEISLAQNTPQEIPMPKTPQTQVVYTIQTCVYEKEKDAQQLVDDLKEKKFDAYIYMDKGKSKFKYRVYVGNFPSKKEALATLKDLSAIFKDSFVRLMN